MAQANWKSASSGGFSVASAWNTNTVPGVGDDAILPADGGAAYTVTVSDSDHVAGIQTAANATLKVFESALGDDNGTDGGVSAGSILVDTASFNFGGNLVNEGTISYNNGSSTLTSNSTLSGGGIVYLSGSCGWSNAGANTFSLTNADDRVFASGMVGVVAGFTNGADAVISSRGKAALTWEQDRDFNLVNDGRIRGASAGGFTIIDGPIVNNGQLISADFDLTVSTAVTGTGIGVVAGGTLAFGSTFSQNVRFAVVNPSGVLQLAQSLTYGGTISGFSHTGANAIDLRDVGFVSSTEATYAGGILTVTDGTHTAQIHLAGAFAGTRFVAADDGQGGVMVTAAGRAAALASASAAFGVTYSGALMSATSVQVSSASLASPQGH